MKEGYKLAMIIGAGVIGAGLLIYSQKDRIMEIISDAITAERIKKLHPVMKPYAERLIHEAKKHGFNLRVTDGYRTFEEQAAIYAKGRTAPGKKVTNAKPGQSYHNYGLAIDVFDINKGYSIDWNKLGQIGKSLGLTWGGDFTSISDRPHFELNKGSWSTLLAKVNAGQVDANGYVIV